MRSIFSLRFLALPVALNARCNVCPDGGDVFNRDKILPFVNLGEAVDSPTCGQFESFVRGIETDCDSVEAQGGYCGCSDVEPIDACSLCPTGVSTPVPERQTPNGDTCGDIETYIRYLSAESCAGIRGETILAHAAFCECPGVEPKCQLCSENIELPNRKKKVPDGKCGDLDDVIKTFTEMDCESTDSLVKVNGVRCGCREAQEIPACELQENSALCTLDLLNTVDEICECYNFCDGVFIGCTNFPGATIAQCPGQLISGCNRASVASNAGFSLARGSRKSVLSCLLGIGTSIGLSLLMG